MHSWQADVLRASDHVFGSFLPPHVLLSQRAARQTATLNFCKDVVNVGKKAKLEEVWFLQKWPLLPSFRPGERCVVMKVYFSCCLLCRSGPGRSSEALQTARSFQITFPPSKAFFFLPCAAKMDNFAHFCGFSETPNQTFKQMIS